MSLFYDSIANIRKKRLVRIILALSFRLPNDKCWSSHSFFASIFDYSLPSKKLAKRRHTETIHKSVLKLSAYCLTAGG